MKKKTFSVILSLALLFSCALLPVSATAFVDLDDPEVTWSDSSCLRLTAPLHANHPVNLPLGTTVSENCTVTWYVKPEKTSVNQTVNFYLTSAYKDGQVDANGEEDNYLTGVSFTPDTNGLSAIPYPERFNWNFNGIGGQFLELDKPYYEYEANVTQAEASMVAEQWNRIDLAVDMVNRKTEVYLNYWKIGYGNFFSETLTGFSAIYIPYVASGSYHCDIDNLLIRKGCQAPQKGDIGSNLNEAVLISGKNQILYFDAFDLKDRTIGANVTVLTAGAVICKRQGYQGYMNEIITTDGIAKQNGAMLRGVQVSSNPETVFNARFTATLDSLDYESVGFDISVGGKEAKEVFCRSVYDSILGSDTTGITQTYGALGSFGANYIYCLTVKGISAAGEQSFIVTPFTYRNGVKTSGVSYHVRFTNGVPTISAA